MDLILQNFIISAAFTQGTLKKYTPIHTFSIGTYDLQRESGFSYDKKLELAYNQMTIDLVSYFGYRVSAIRMQSGTVFYILSLYMPSQGGSEDLETSLDELSDIIDTIEGNSLCILCGDFNGDMGALGGSRRGATV